MRVLYMTVNPDGSSEIVEEDEQRLVIQLSPPETAELLGYIPVGETTKEFDGFLLVAIRATGSRAVESAPQSKPNLFPDR